MSLKNPYKQGGMFEGASHIIFANAKHLRKNMTTAETILWMHLKGGVRNLKFRRQHPLGIYIADFYCHKIKLVIEADGSIHNKPEVKEYDEKRENDLINSGYYILRFTNSEIMNDMSPVLNKIESTVDFLLQNLINKPK